MIRIALAALLAAPAAFAATYQIDNAHSQAGFTVTHMMVSKVHGRFKDIKGTVEFDEKHPDQAKVEAVIDASTIDTGDPKRDGHLKSADFFDVANHPKITFKSKKVQRKGDGKWDITGDLTIRGVTKEVVLHAEGFEEALATPWGTNKRGGSATTTINRKDFGVNWQKNLDKGGVVVSDQVTINLDVEIDAKREKAASN